MTFLCVVSKTIKFENKRCNFTCRFNFTEFDLKNKYISFYILQFNFRDMLKIK